MSKYKNHIILIGALASLLATQAGAQVFWTETFNNGCTTGCLVSTYTTGANGAWTLDNTAPPGGTCNDVYSNKWFVSCAENSNAVGACGTGCGSNATLHIGADDGIFYDVGASYDAGGFGGCGLGGTSTYTRAVSPLISTLGLSGITVSFRYITYGAQPGFDYGWVEYSVNGGTSWAALVNPMPLTACCGVCNGSSQGKWTLYTSGTLPATANNISNFRLRFCWTNNDDAIGTDPSFAIGNLTVSAAIGLPITLLSFSANYNTANSNVDVQWATATESNNKMFTIQKSIDGENWQPITQLQGAGNSRHTTYYSITDNSTAPGSLYYYRLKQTDYDGHFTYFNPVAVTIPSTLTLISVYPNPGNGVFTIQSSVISGNASVVVYNVLGEKVASLNPSYGGTSNSISYPLPTGKGWGWAIDLSSQPSGIYFIELNASGKTVHGKLIR